MITVNWPLVVFCVFGIIASTCWQVANYRRDRKLVEQLKADGIADSKRAAQEVSLRRPYRTVLPTVLMSLCYTAVHHSVTFGPGAPSDAKRKWFEDQHLIDGTMLIFLPLYTLWYYWLCNRKRKRIEGEDKK